MGFFVRSAPRCRASLHSVPTCVVPVLRSTVRIGNLGVRACTDDSPLAFLLLLLMVFAAITLFAILVVAFTMLVALGTTYAALSGIFIWGLFSALGGLALSAVSRQLDGPRWSWAFATLLLAVSTLAELGLAFAFRQI